MAIPSGNDVSERHAHPNGVQDSNLFWAIRGGLRGAGSRGIMHQCVAPVMEWNMLGYQTIPSVFIGVTTLRPTATGASSLVIASDASQDLPETLGVPRWEVPEPDYRLRCHNDIHHRVCGAVWCVCVANESNTMLGVPQKFIWLDVEKASISRIDPPFNEIRALFNKFMVLSNMIRDSEYSTLTGSPLP